MNTFDSYTVLGNDLYLTLEHWSFLTGLQVVVTGLNPSKNSDYTLSCNRFSPLVNDGLPYTVTPADIQVVAGTRGDAAEGLKNADGAAFVFADTDSYDAAADYMFCLTDNTGSAPVVTRYVVPGKTIEKNTSRIKGIKLAASSFSAASNLSSGGTANTYMVSNPGFYCFDATVKGNGGLDPTTGVKATAISNIAGVRVLWEINARGKAIKYDGGYSVSYSDGLVFFSTPETIEDGAAYVGVVDSSGNILWSWLIWTAEVAPSTLTYSEGGKTWNYMDRNLGALSTDGKGFMYQWGRKDPFPASGSTEFVPALTTAFSHAHVNDINSTVAYVVAHPTTFISTSDGSGFDGKHNWLEESCNTLWGDAKTIYDPSPAGWKIPSYNDVVRADDAEHSYFYHCYTNAGFGRWDKGYDVFHYGNIGKGYCWTSTSRTDYPQSAYYVRNYGSGSEVGQLTYVNSKSDGYVVRCIVDTDGNSGND